MSALRVIRVSLGLAAFAVIATIAAQRFIDRQAVAQTFSLCYPAGDCPTCVDSGNFYYCEKIFVDEFPGNCGGGNGNCEYLTTCEFLFDCRSATNIGECLMYGCRKE